MSYNPEADERAPLLPDPPVPPQREAAEHAVPARIARRLYISHFLSTWSSRVFEFGAILYLATIYPGTLQPMSVYALTRGLAAIIFAAVVGQYIDTGNRLQVVVVAKKDEAALRVINGQMRRIDLLCKLLGPLFIALVDGISTDTAIIVNFAMNLLYIPVEYFAIARIYHVVPELQQSKKKAPPVTSNAESSQEPQRRQNSESRLMHNWRHVLAVAKKSAADFNLYFQHRAFLPSTAGALLYLTVLNFAGQMVTYLLSAGYNTTDVGIARTLSVVFEVLATWTAPWMMGKIGPVEAGLWLGSWQVTMLVTGVAVFLGLRG
ncbi:hypothetical protein INS49_014182 [Diaporthe citri]|uniref:uncharacterized protein n=1 Tax=Diaporthe citri TaxID=83186 RepID=UPI001C7F5933|nr:uncharacterized protein INS49_014182 [Diaporthe citri]KAG6358298.1 hypothetical protein INS49_014182 [Diaporthe citri]